MRIRVLQVATPPEEPVAARVERVAAQVAGAGGADLVVLPELWAHGGFDYSRWPERAELLDGPTIGALRAAARSAGAVVHAGSIIERTGSGDRGLSNTSVVIGPDGAILATYRKIHRFGFAAGEPALLDAGSDPVLVNLPLPHAADGAAPVRAGLATCYDLRFPELFRRLLDGGATAFLLPAAWPSARIGHWTLLGRARAVENQCLVVAVNGAASGGRVPLGGRSQVVSASGEVLSEAGEGEATLDVDVDPAAITRYREDFPVLRDRRL